MNPSDKRNARQRGRKESTRDNVIQIFMNIDGEDLRPVHHLSGRDRYYFLLGIARNKRADGLTPAEIEFILKKRLMIKGIHRSNIRRDLRNSRELVERFPLGRGYAYKITKAGEEHLQSIFKKMAG